MNGFKTGRLFEPHTQYFNDKVHAESIVAFGGKQSSWIGINAKGGPWVYTSSGDDLDIENWQPGQPNSNAHDCVYWGLEGHVNGKWADEGCNSRTEFFICEFV